MVMFSWLKWRTLPGAWNTIFAKFPFTLQIGAWENPKCHSKYRLRQLHASGRSYGPTGISGGQEGMPASDRLPAWIGHLNTSWGEFHSNLRLYRHPQAQYFTLTCVGQCSFPPIFPILSNSRFLLAVVDQSLHLAGILLIQLE